MLNGRVITFISSKGGVGKTVLASNLAVSLSMEGKLKIAFVDLNHNSYRDTRTIFNKLKNTSFSLLDTIEITASETEGLKTEADPHNLFRVINRNKPISKSGLDSAIKNLKKECNYVIIDTEQHFCENLLTALDNSDLALVITTPDTLSLNHCRAVLTELIEANFSSDKTRIVMNRTSDISIMNNAELEKHLNKDIFTAIPEEYSTVTESINREIPFTAAGAKSPISKAVEKMAFQIHSGRDRRGAPVFHGTVESVSSKATNDAECHSGSEYLKIQQESDIKDTRDELKSRIHKQLIKELNFMDNAIPETLHREVENKAREILERENIMPDSRQDRITLLKEIMDEVLGLGLLEKLLANDEVTEIMVNGANMIFVETNGQLKKTNSAFIDNHHVLRVIERIIMPLGKRLDESSPYVDARLADGSRVNAIISPLSLEGPILTIRKFNKTIRTIDSLIKNGTLNENMAKFIKLCVLSRKNIIISGGTGSGKTTLLNMVSGFIPVTERIVTIEDSAELRLPQEHVVRLESKPSNIEGKGSVTIRDLVRNALRMRPDRIVIGECRGGETFDMLQAMNTGHDGSITTVHANSSRDALSRIETMVLMAGMDLPIRAIREQLASAIQIVIQMTRFLCDGSRKIIQISELTGVEQGIITMQDIFRFNQKGIGASGKVMGDFNGTGFVPAFLEELKTGGFNVDMELFQ